MKDGFTSFRIVPSREQWLRALAVPPDWKRTVVIPLPPDLNETNLERLNAVAQDLADRGGATICPVDAVISVGTRGKMAADFFSWLTGSPHLPAELGERSLGSIQRHCSDKSNVLISCDKDFAAFGLTEISSALGKLKVNFGYIYAFDTESALIAAFKAAFEPDSSERANYLINAMSRLNIDEDFGELHVAAGASITAERMQELLVRRAHFKVIFSHGNGFDYNLGKAVLCCIPGTIPVLNDPLLFSCFQTGECTRSGQQRVGVDVIQSEVLLMATCWGVLDGSIGLDYARTAYGRLIAGSGVWSLMATATAWTAAPHDWLRIQHVLSNSPTLGEATRRLNHELDSVHATFLLFGNPRVTLKTIPNGKACVEIHEANEIRDLPSGFRMLQVKASSQSDFAVYIVRSEAGSASGHADFATSAHLPRGTLAAFSETTLTIQTAPVQRLGPRPGMKTYARLCHNIAIVERLLPGLLQSQDQSLLAQRIATLSRRSVMLGRWMENRETENGIVLFEEEYGGLIALHDEWLSVAQGVVSEWLAWSTGQPAARFIMDVWRSEFRQVKVAEGPRCQVCAKPTRNQLYASLAFALPERTLSLCRICSTKSDFPSAFHLSIDMRKIIEREDQFEVLASLVNGCDDPALMAAAIFLMSANRVWPACVWQQEATWIKQRETMELNCTIPKPEGMVPGAHWIVILGLFDGAPFTHCTKVHFLRDAEPGTSLLPPSAFSKLYD